MNSLTLYEVKPGLKFSLTTLKELLPTIEVTLFFAKLYKLDVEQLSKLLYMVHRTHLIEALVGGTREHSVDLQDYLVELGYEYLIDEGAITFESAPPKGEVLPELWKAAEVQIATSIQEVADRLKEVVSLMPGKEGHMVFQSMMTVNAKRPVLGDYRAHVHHERQRENLVVLDVSGSMSEATVRTIIDDVVALSYLANAHLAVVSNTATHWGPGEYDSEVVLQVCEFSGTHYETLAGLFDSDWGVVVTIADYDSSPAALSAIAKCRGRIEQVLDISLVNRPTYLAEVVGQLASEVKPLLVATDLYAGSNW